MADVQRTDPHLGQGQHERLTIGHDDGSPMPRYNLPDATAASGELHLTADNMTPANEDAVRDAFQAQAEASIARGLLFTARLSEALGRVLDRRTEVGRRVLEWRGRPDARGDSVPLRLAGGLHALVRRGRLPRLAALYPPHPPPEAEALSLALDEALREAGGELLPWLDRQPQTNAPLRSAPLMAGLLVIAARTGRKPLALYEAGASAGLLLVLDRYHNRLGETEAGDRRSSVVVAPQWRGDSPAAAKLTIQSRRGSDLDPLDVTKEEDRERLLAYVWPDQAERLARVEAAIALAAQDPPPIDRADAAEWAERTINPEPEPGRVRVLMHAVALQYAPEETRARVTAHAARVGERATDAVSDGAFADRVGWDGTGDRFAVPAGLLLSDGLTDVTAPPHDALDADGTVALALNVLFNEVAGLEHGGLLAV